MLGGTNEPPMPGPTYMSRDQQARYLQSLRKPHPSRPTGSRPAPPSKLTALKRSETTLDHLGHVQSERPGLPTSNSLPVMQGPSLSHRRTESNLSSKSLFTGRPLVRPASATPSEGESVGSTEEQRMHRRPSVQYMERGTRWMEKQEVRSVRMALEDMDLEKEKRLHEAARDEAAGLVWEHRNPEAAKVAAEAPYANPDVRRDYRQHLRKGSYQRSHSQDTVPLASSRSASGGSQNESVHGSIGISKRKSIEVPRKVSPPSAVMAVQKTRRTPSGKSYGGLAEAVASDISQAHRRISSGSKRILSGEKKMFMHPNDRIWEDPQEDHSPASQKIPSIEQPNITAAPASVPTHVRKNPFARVRLQAEKLERANSEPILPGSARQHNVEIQKNSPSQSKRPWYMSNEPLPPTPPKVGVREADEVSPKVTPTKDGKEIRSDDIRAATSKQRKDYSPKLPRPTVVSDKPGRPIVSFKQDWKPKEVVLEEIKAAPQQGVSSSSYGLSRAQTEPMTNSVLQISVDEPSKPPIPIINLPDDQCIPTIAFPEETDFAEASNAHHTPMISIEPPTISVQLPAINVCGPEETLPRQSYPPQRPSNPSSRPLPHHAATSPLPKSTPHYTPSIRQSGTLCTHCALPIAGRILSAAGQRFHPNCFVCHQCHTNLELVAFYPEPEARQAERLHRIATRQAGAQLALPEGTTDEEACHLELADGHPSPRFYCHLDFHELFSPRCKSCKTPIEGEVIVACGAEWHAGHFFCAQCGDPFDSSTPFVEKDGYAWCVGCHTNRYSSKCRKCRKPVTDTVVKAMGFDWHGQCFVCTECSGEFQDGQYFLRGSSHDPVCMRCEERRLKS